MEQHTAAANGKLEKGFKISQQHQEDKHKTYLARIKLRLRGRSFHPCIFRFIGNLGSQSQRPHIVSIGPYHRGRDHDRLADKSYFLAKLLSKDLDLFLMEMTRLEARTRECYMDVGPISSYDFIEMMLLDGCFVVEFLRFLGKSGDTDSKPIFMRPSVIPLVIADLLKLENQLPFFVLESLFQRETELLLPFIMEAISFALPLPNKVSSTTHLPKPKHLLELVYDSLLPRSRTTSTHHTSNET